MVASVVLQLGQHILDLAAGPKFAQKSEKVPSYRVTYVDNQASHTTGNL